MHIAVAHLTSFLYKRRYVGRRNELPPPVIRREQIEQAWDNILNEDLAIHITNINQNIRYEGQQKGTNETAWDPELLLTGYQTGRSGTGRLDLSPRIWFKCGSDWAEKIVRDEVKSLSWMASKGLGDCIEVGDLRAAGLAVDPHVPIPKRLELKDGVHLPIGFELYLSVERPDQVLSACGLWCSIVIAQGKIPKSHGICKIGGVFSVKDNSGTEKLVGVTAAHGLLDQSLTADSHTKSVKPTTARPRRLRRILDKATLSSGSVSPPIGDGGLQSSSTHPLDEVEWEPIRGIYAINWLGGGWEETLQFQFPFRVSDPERLTPDADFALLELPSVLSNIYETSSSFPPWVTGWLPEDQMENDTVSLIISRDTIISATLVYEKPNLYLRGRRFPTRKIQLNRPLGMLTIWSKVRKLTRQYSNWQLGLLGCPKPQTLWYDRCVL
jgi:hypothetical protein